MKIEIRILIVSGWWLLSYLAYIFAVFPVIADFGGDADTRFLRSSILDVSVLTAAVIAAGLMAGGSILWKRRLIIWKWRKK